MFFNYFHFSQRDCFSFGLLVSLLSVLIKKKFDALSLLREWEEGHPACEICQICDCIFWNIWEKKNTVD